MKNNIRERLSDYAHDALAGWTVYMWSDIEIEGVVQRCVVIPDDSVVRWERQMNSPYDELPENEKESDRAEADKMLEIMAESEDAR